MSAFGKKFLPASHLLSACPLGDRFDDKGLGFSPATVQQQMETVTAGQKAGVQTMIRESLPYAGLVQHQHRC